MGKERGKVNPERVRQRFSREFKLEARCDCLSKAESPPHNWRWSWVYSETGSTSGRRSSAQRGMRRFMARGRNLPASKAKLSA